MSVCKWMTTRGTLTFCTITVELVPESSIAAKLLSPGFLFFFKIIDTQAEAHPGADFTIDYHIVTRRQQLQYVPGWRRLVEVWWRSGGGVRLSSVVVTYPTEGTAAVLPHADEASVCQVCGWTSSAQRFSEGMGGNSVAWLIIKMRCQ